MDTRLQQCGSRAHAPAGDVIPSFVVLRHDVIRIARPSAHQVPYPYLIEQAHELGLLGLGALSHRNL
jgi:hypothetical protein